MKKLTKKQIEIVKREHPECFNGIEAGKWYNLNPGECLLFVTGLRHGGAVVVYGFDYDGNWRDDGTIWGTGGAAEATPEEIESALISEAKRRYKVGDMVSKLGRLYSGNGNSMIISDWKNIYVDYDTLWVNSTNSHRIPLFKSGQWASVIPEEKPSLQDDIQALKDRWPDINFTIIAEGKR